MTAKSAQKWIPLESNPQVLNKYVYGLGMSDEWSFVDVFGLDPDLLALVPQPVAALILLFPDEKFKDKVIGEIVKDAPADLYYTKQTISNACGTVAIVHSLANSEKQIPFNDDGHFKTFLKNTKTLSPADRATYLEGDEKMGAAHDESAHEGDTAAPALGDSVKHHFVAFVPFGDSLYELDGRKEGPVTHGKLSDNGFLQDAAKIVQKFMAVDPENLNFNVLALVKGKAD